MIRSISITTGVDIISVDRLAKAVDQWQDSFLKRIYTDSELEYCKGATSSLAARFAAKEAVMKAIGCGMFNTNWRDIEILTESNGKPYINLKGRSRNIANEKGINDFAVSLSHDKHYAIAFVVAYVT